MKRLILILLPIAFCLSTIHAQTWTDDELANGKVTRVKSGTKSAILSYGVLDSSALAKSDSLLRVEKDIRSWLAAIMTYTDALEAKNDSLLNVIKNNRTYLAALAAKDFATQTTLASLLTEQQKKYVCVKDTSLAFSTAAAIMSYACDAVSVEPTTAGLTLLYGKNSNVATNGMSLFLYDKATIPVTANASEIYLYCASANTVKLRFLRKQ